MAIKSIRGAAAAIALIATAGSAGAADLGGNCCADLEERIAELEATTARKGNRKIKLTVSGQVNEMLTFFDDGHESNVYQVTNYVSSTRFRFVGEGKVNDDVSVGYLLELGVAGVRSDTVDQNNDDGSGGVAIRHSAWWLQSKTLGKISLGQTSQATDNITEISLANLGHVSSSNVPGRFGAFFARSSTTGALSTQRLVTFMGGANSTASTGVDSAQVGEGNRRNLVRYDTPTIAGFIASAAYGEDKFWDVALRYAGEFGGFKLAAGIGYERTTEGPQSGTVTGSERNCVAAGNTGGAVVTKDVSCQQLGLSASIMHASTGLFLAGAYGKRWDDNAALGTLSALSDTSERYYVQGGIEQKFFPLGKTTIYGEYQENKIGQTGVKSDGTSGNGVRSAHSTIWGVGLNQNIEAAAMDLYVTYSHVGDLKADIGAGSKDYEAIQFVMMGARIQY